MMKKLWPLLAVLLLFGCTGESYGPIGPGNLTHFQNLSNVSDQSLMGYLHFANDITFGWMALSWIIGIWAVMLIAFKEIFRIEVALASSTFTAFIMSVLMSWLGLVDISIAIIIGIVLFISIIIMRGGS